MLHRDVKPENVLFGQNGQVKLADLGVAMFLSDEQAYRDTMQGTQIYFAPEILSEVRYAKPVDIWCFGLFAYQLPTNIIPFLDGGRQELNNVMAMPTPQLPEGRFTNEYQTFINACL